MMTFCTWLFSAVADFLMMEPICYFVGIAFSLCIISLIKKLINVAK